jgi:EAL domain-containing protein (putative c-di-GMP-specific phosphodiesterase class I)/GGDEF domain-containing protein
VLKRISKWIPNASGLDKAEWFNRISCYYERYRSRLIMVALIIGCLVPAVFCAIDLVTGATGNYLQYGLAFGVMLSVLIPFVFFRNNDIFSLITLALAWGGLLVCLYLPGSRSISLLLFFCFPPLFFQILGTRYGVLSASLMFVSVIVSRLLGMAGVLPLWSVEIPHDQVFMAGAAFSAITVLEYYGGVQHDKYMDSISTSALFDDTTGLPNRRVLPHCLADNKTYLFAILRIENFNELGLLFGYEFSDEILVFLTRKLRGMEEQFGFQAFRMKGHEFGLLFDIPEHRNINHEKFLHDFVEGLQKQGLPWDSTHIHLVYRAGGVVVKNTLSREYLSQADMALQEARQKHREVVIYSENINIRTETMASMNNLSVLVDNIHNRKLRVLFQPIVDSRSGDVVWYETLLRITGPDGELESPIQYLPIAESVGFHKMITDFVLIEACRALEFVAADISINISFQDMMRVEFLQLLEENYAGGGIKKGRLILEILEQEDLFHVEACLLFLEKAKALNCLIAIDDFGSGYANFKNLLSLPVDIVKIDGDVIQKINSDSRVMHLVLQIINYCRMANVRVAAEYVDSEHLSRLLCSIDIDYMQGFYFGRPAQLVG